MRSDPYSIQSDVEVASFSNVEKLHLSEHDVDDISDESENKLSKSLRDAEFGEREILRLIENLSKVHKSSSASSEHGCSTVRIEHYENTPEEIEETSSSMNVNSNTYFDKPGPAQVGAVSKAQT